jgi:hypothetical protein
MSLKIAILSLVWGAAAGCDGNVYCACGKDFRRDVCVPSDYSTVCDMSRQSCTSRMYTSVVWLYNEPSECWQAASKELLQKKTATFGRRGLIDWWSGRSCIQKYPKLETTPTSVQEGESPVGVTVFRLTEIYLGAFAVSSSNFSNKDSGLKAFLSATPAPSLAPSPGDIEKMICKVAGNKFMEDLMTSKACTTAKQLLNVTNPDCQGDAEKLWDMVAKMCPKDLEEAAPSPGDIKKMICSLAGNSKLEAMITSKACTMAQERHVNIPDCQANAEKLWNVMATQICSEASEVTAPFATAGNLAVSFHVCGDASTDVAVKDVTPKTIAAGSTTTITGSGSLKKDLTGATYTMTMTGALSTVLVKDCSGDAAQAQTCDIVAPLLGKVGSLAYQPVTFPIKAGDISGIPKVAVTLKPGLPASLETTTTTLKVTASNGDKAICVQIMTKAESALPLVVV